MGPLGARDPQAYALVAVISRVKIPEMHGCLCEQSGSLPTMNHGAYSAVLSWVEWWCLLNLSSRTAFLSFSPLARTQRNLTRVVIRALQAKSCAPMAKAAIPLLSMLMVVVFLPIWKQASSIREVFTHFVPLQSTLPDPQSICQIICFEKGWVTCYYSAPGDLQARVRSFTARSHAREGGGGSKVVTFSLKDGEDEALEDQDFFFPRRVATRGLSVLECCLRVRVLRFDRDLFNRTNYKMSRWNHVTEAPADPILGVSVAFKADTVSPARFIGLPRRVFPAPPSVGHRNLPGSKGEK